MRLHKLNLISRILKFLRNIVSVGKDASGLLEVWVSHQVVGLVPLLALAVGTVIFRTLIWLAVFFNVSTAS